VEVLSDDECAHLKSKLAPLEPPSAGLVRRIAAFERLTAEPIREPRYADRAIDLSRPARIDGPAIYERHVAAESIAAKGRPYPFAVYAYRVRAVNALKVESGPGAAALTIPSAPRQLFSKEDGEACRLRWQANPEKALRGYRVYRLDGRWDKDPISRLTADPIAALEFADTQAGRASRRYHIVAVDVLGQEGQPSSPVWHRREWRDFYAPFEGEWHQ
jgi:hypothetical protein